MSTVPIDLEPQDLATEASANVVEEAMSWEYGLGREAIAPALGDVPAGS